MYLPVIPRALPWAGMPCPFGAPLHHAIARPPRTRNTTLYQYLSALQPPRFTSRRNWAPDSATLLSSCGVALSRHGRVRCWWDWLMPAGATSRAGSSTAGAARRRGGSPRYPPNLRYPPISHKKYLLWLVSTGMVANKFRASPEPGGPSALRFAAGYAMLVTPCHGGA